MYYQVTDMTESVGEHDILVRILKPEDDNHQCIAYISCVTCHRITEYKFKPTDNMTVEDNMIMARMEANLHAEGFDTGWDFGSLTDDDLED